MGLAEGDRTACTGEYVAAVEDAGNPSARGRRSEGRGASHPLRSRSRRRLRSLQPVGAAAQDATAPDPLGSGITEVAVHCAPSALAVSSIPAPTSPTPTTFAIRSPAGARRSRLIAAAATSIAGPFISPEARSTSVTPAQQRMQCRPARSPSRQAGKALVRALSACRTHRDAATRIHSSRCAPGVRDPATGACPTAHRGRARTSSTCDTRPPSR